MNPKDFGKVVNQITTSEGNPFFTILGHKREIYNIEVLSGGMVLRGQIVGGEGAHAQFSWQDVKQENGFIRSVGNKQSWHFTKDGEILSYKLVPCKNFKVQSIDKNLEKNFVAWDLESSTVPNKDGSQNIVPYLICAYNGTQYFNSYTDTQPSAQTTISTEKMFSNFLKTLVI